MKINFPRLRLVRTPGILVGAIKEAVIKHWYLGLQKQRDYHTTTELKLGGCPWWADSNDAVESRSVKSIYTTKENCFQANRLEINI